MNIKMIEANIEYIRKVDNRKCVDVKDIEGFISMLSIPEKIIKKLKLKVGMKVITLQEKNYIVGIKLENGLAYLD